VIPLIRPANIGAPCPILSAFSAERVGSPRPCLTAGSKELPHPSDFARTFRTAPKKQALFSKSICFKSALRRAVCLLVCLLPVRQAWSQDPQPTPARKAPAAASIGFYRIAGTVVNSMTGAPVPRATVDLLNHPQGQIVATVLCGDDGRFSIEKLPAAKFQLTASKRGFLTGYFEQHEDYNSAVVTGQDQETSNLTFRLTPDAVLHGVITGDGGDPVDGAQVMLFRKPSQSNSTARIAQIGSVTTDDTGAYEFSDLAPGTYLLAVKATPWYATPHTSNPSRSGSNERPPSAVLDVAYPITFFESTTDEAASTPIVLAAGSREEADLNLHAVPALHLNVPLKSEPATARNSAQPPSVPQIPPTALHQLVFGTEISREEASFINFPERSSTREGSAEFSGVAPGHYELEVGYPPRTMDLEANANQQIDPSQATPSVQVAVWVRSSAGAAIEEIQALTLESLDAANRFVPMTAPSRPGAAFTAAVPPGDWKIWVVSSGNSWLILSVAGEGKSQPGNRLKVRDHALSLLVTVTQSATRIEGFARKNDKGAPGAMIVLLPTNPGADPGLIRRDQSDSDGSFALVDVAPGDYILAAIENGWDLDWQQPQRMSRYLSLGIPVTIKGDSAKLIRLSQPVPVQPAAATP